jgi:hypothetical protein
MTGHGILRRHAHSGLWRRDHDLSGTDWSLVLRLPRENALHLLDHGVLAREGGVLSDSFHPGILVTRDGLEARLCLARPETTIASIRGGDHGLAHEETTAQLADLWLSDRSTLTP